MSKTEMPEIINIRGQIHARTERDILFSTDGDQESAVWLPLARPSLSGHAARRKQAAASGQ